MTTVPAQLSYAFAKRHGVLIVETGNDSADIVYRPDTHYQSLLEVRRHLARALRPRAVSTQEFNGLLQSIYEGSHSNAARMMADLGEELDLNQIAAQLPEPEDLLESADDAPIIRLINALLSEAIKENASDIHIESFEHMLRVRFRIDGMLQEALQPPRALGPLLVSRVKVMANLDIAEKRLPQDGRISLRLAGRPVDVRVSTIPTGYGERVVLRLLDKREGRLNLTQLGLAREVQQLLTDLAQRPHGILLVTGPTGSGKTTTLYALLNHLNDLQRNIMTVEDPIEYYLEGISQTQVNGKVDMSFARSLRAILRQDPDVVMVGECRDLETAEIAVQSSLTGHLVLSTLHTNSAVGAITRLRDMGVEPFLLSSSLIGILAQRLVRQLCPHCKIPDVASDQDRQLLGIGTTAKAPVVYLADGCEHCNQQGYRGRTGVFELVPVDQQLQALIHDNASEQILERHARTLTPSLYQDSIRRVLNGTTSVAEFVRVTREA
jgi:general secretion pathway protein E